MKLLKDRCKAPSEDGKAIMIEATFPEVTDNGYASASASVFQLDTIVLADNPGEKQRTERKNRQRQVCSPESGPSTVCNCWAIEFYKKMYPDQPVCSIFCLR